MNLSAHEQHALDTIEDGLAGADPKLASMLATFNRLAVGEEMPVRETSRAGRSRTASHRHRYRRRRRRVRVGPACRRGHQWVAPLLFLVMAVSLAAMVAVALVAGQGGARACTYSFTLVCTGQAHAHTSRPAEHEAAVRVDNSKKRASAPGRVSASTVGHPSMVGHASAMDQAAIRERP